MPVGMNLEDSRPIARLSEIDRRILRLVAQGRSSKEIAQEMGRSPLTIDGRLKDVCVRLGAENRVQAATMLLIEEGADPPQDLGGPQRRGIAEDAGEARGVAEEGAAFVPAPQSSVRSRVLPEVTGPAARGGTAVPAGQRSLLGIARTVLLILVALACAAFFLASAMEAFQGAFHAAVGAE